MFKDHETGEIRLWLSRSVSVLIFIMVFCAVAFVVNFAQQESVTDLTTTSKDLGDIKTEYQISKIEAEIDKIRSETTGSNFALKLFGLFVTVGGAVGGYLAAQSSRTLKQLDFDNRKNVDSVFQAIVQELSSDSAILRAAAAVKLGAILHSFPVEWSVKKSRKEELISLSKNVLAAAMSIETDAKVLKVLSINVARHRIDHKVSHFSLDELDFSGAAACDAYWANSSFRRSDLFNANLMGSSFRNSSLLDTQFREADLRNCVFDNADCHQTNFTKADLRGASFKGTKLIGVNFENAKVFDIKIAPDVCEQIPDCDVDVSKDGNGRKMVSVKQWLRGFN